MFQQMSSSPGLRRNSASTITVSLAVTRTEGGSAEGVAFTCCGVPELIAARKLTHDGVTPIDTASGEAPLHAASMDTIITATKKKDV
jgi:hypothetical protein